MPSLNVVKISTTSLRVHCELGLYKKPLSITSTLDFDHQCASYSNILSLFGHIYRPHPKDWGRYCFQFICQSTPRSGGGGYPIPGPGGGLPHPRSGWGYPIPSPCRGVPHSRSRWGVPHPANGGYSIPGLDGLVPHPRSRWGVPHQLMRGVLPPARTGWGTPPH